MRITFLLPSPNLSGGIRVTCIYAAGLQRRGHEVLMISAPHRAVTLLDTARTVIKKRKFPKRSRVDTTLLDQCGVPYRLLEKFRPVTDADVPDGDAVIATWWETAPWANELAASKGRKFYFVQDFGANVGQPLDELIETWRMPMHQILISNFLMELVKKHVPDAPMSYVPNSVDTKQFFADPRGKQKQPTVGFVYSTTPFKGADIYYAAVQEARKTLPDLHVCAFGPHDPKPELPLPPGSEFTKKAPEHKLREIYARCDAWLFAPRMEGYGLPILEAFACRTPVIATPAGAAPELIDQGGGILVKPENPSDMAAAIVKVASMQDSDWRAMSDAAHRTACRYTWEDAIDRFEAALRNR